MDTRETSGAVDATTRRPARGPFPWLSTRHGILREAFGRMSDAIVTYYNIGGELHELHGQVSNINLRVAGHEQPAEGEAPAGSLSAAVGQIATLQVAAVRQVRHLQYLLGDFPQFDRVVIPPPWGDDGAKRRAALTPGKAPGDETWMLAKLAKIVPAHRKLLAALDSMTMRMMELDEQIKKAEGVEEDESGDLSVDPEDFARDAFHSARRLATTYETLWAALQLARKHAETGLARAPRMGSRRRDSGRPTVQ